MYFLSTCLPVYLYNPISVRYPDALLINEIWKMSNTELQFISSTARCLNDIVSDFSFLKRTDINYTCPLYFQGIELHHWKVPGNISTRLWRMIWTTGPVPDKYGYMFAVYSVRTWVCCHWGDRIMWRMRVAN